MTRSSSRSVVIDDELTQLLTSVHQEAHSQFVQIEQSSAAHVRKISLLDEKHRNIFYTDDLVTAEIARKLDNLNFAINAEREEAFYQLLLQRHRNPLATVDADILELASKMDALNFVVSVHGTCHDIHSAVLEEEIAILLPVSKFLDQAHLFSKIFSPIRVGIGGFLTLFDIYRTILTRQSATDKAVKITASIAVLTLSIVAVAIPPLGFFLVGAAMLVGFASEIFSYVRIANNLKTEKARLEQYRDKFDALSKIELFGKDVVKGKSSARRSFLLLINEKQKERIAYVANLRSNARKGLFTTFVGIAGTFLLVPPVTIFGVGILTSLLAYNIGIGLFSWLGKCFKSKKPEVRPSSHLLTPADMTESEAHESKLDLSPKIAGSQAAILSRVQSSMSDNKISPESTKRQAELDSVREDLAEPCFINPYLLGISRSAFAGAAATPAEAEDTSQNREVPAMRTI